MVHHQVVARVEKALYLQETSFGAFLDTKRAFNNTWYDTMCDVLVSHGTEYTIVWWIRATMDGRVAVATLDGLSVWLAIYRCCSQRGVMLPLLWCLVVDDLLARFSEGGVFVQGYTDTHVFSRWVNSQTRYQDSCNGLFQPQGYGGTRSDSRSIPMSLDSFHIPGKGNSRGSLNHNSLRLN